MNKKLFRAICVTTLATFSCTQLTGCFAGGFGLTRKVGEWNAHLSIIPRVIVYLVFVTIVPVYWLTMLFDLLLNNTVEFWSGKQLVTQNQTFEKDGVEVVVQHSRDPLRKTVITVYDKNGRQDSMSELRETSRGTVEVFVNKEKKAELNSIGDAMVEMSTLNGTKYIAVPDPAERDVTKLAALRQTVCAAIKPMSMPPSLIR